MRMLGYFTAVFIDAFGITRPTTEGQDRAAVYIATLILAIIIMLGSGAALALHFAGR